MDTRNNIMPQFLAAFVCVMTLAPFAHATPLDCPGVKKVPGGYQLTRDTTCAGFGWSERNKFFSLNGFTLTIGFTNIGGDGLTMRNGRVRPTDNFLTIGRGGILSNLAFDGSRIAPFSTIEAGDDTAVKKCTFSNFPQALTFYFGAKGGRVENSVFIGNRTGLSIQRTSGVLIKNNTFVRNSRGLNLFDEDGAGVNNIAILNNNFRNNGVGINMFAHSAGFPPAFPSMQGNRIIGNRVERSGDSGFYLQMSCNPFDSPIICSGQNTVVSGNQFNRNGFASGSMSAPDDNDDGMTARAYFVTGSPGDPVGEAYPEGLAGVKLTRNSADRNTDFGFDVFGVTDGRGNNAKFNRNPAQCNGIVCRRRSNASGSILLKALPTAPQSSSQATIQTIPTMLESIALEFVPEAPLPSDQLLHHKVIRKP